MDILIRAVPEGEGQTGETSVSSDGDDTTVGTAMEFCDCIPTKLTV